ncbi:holin [Microbacterium sp. p3-SID338]|uniref:holin n=1 Tax=Microbacterium sp. p3-SID338 TaxID=2916214 RepID=UPI0021A3659C|nr:holin [Microbacterium sp. p3-SID338]MCT1395683.1 holin [Microbacterium sp. p3-SID338]
MSKLTDPAWWKAAVLRAIYTAIAIAIPYIAAVQFADVPWLMAASAATVGAILSIATSLFGLPESVGVDLPWWLAALERVAKTFGQSLAAGLTGAVLLTDVDWLVVLQAALGAAFISLLRLILATLPADPTPAPSTALAQTENGTWVDTPTVDPDLGAIVRDHRRRAFP